MTLSRPHPTQPAEAASSRLRPFGRNNDRFRSSSGSIAAIGWEFQKALSASGCAGTTGQRLAPAPLQAESLLPDDVKSTSAAGSIAAVIRSHSAPTVPSAYTGSIGHRVPPQMVAAPKRAESSRVRSRLGTRKPGRNGATCDSTNVGSAGTNAPARPTTPRRSCDATTQVSSLSNAVPSHRQLVPTSRCAIRGRSQPVAVVPYSLTRDIRSARLSLPRRPTAEPCRTG